MARRRSGIVIAVIGAGSSYTPMIVQELAQRAARLAIEELRLYDIDPDRLRTVARFAERLVGGAISIATSRSLVRALDGADFVLSQFRVGGLQARHRDIKLGLRYGLIGQETTGIGGFAKALRTIPVTIKICRAMRTRASAGAWLLNFANPSGIVTEAALKHGGVNCIGLCNGPLGLHERVAKTLAVAPADLTLDYVGANHLGWVRGVCGGGRDLTAALKRKTAAFRPGNVPDAKLDPVFERVIGLPYNAYLHYYYYADAMFRAIAGRKETRAQQALAIERKLFRKYRDPRVAQIPGELSGRGGAGYNLVAADVIESIANDTGGRHIVNVRNGGTLPGIEPDASVEVTCRISAEGAVPLFPGRPLAPHVRGMLQVVKAYEELAVTAGVGGDLEAALHALVIHPLGPTAGQAGRLLKDLLRMNRDHLPQFKPDRIRRFFAR